MTATLPLSMGQLGLWSLDRRYGDRGAYNLTYAWKLDQPRDIDALRQAILATCDAHPAWQVRFEETDAGVHQRHEPDARAPIEQTALDDTLDGTWDAFARREAARPLDLVHALPLRWTIATHREQAVGLMLVVHHIVADAWSVAVVLDQIGRHLQGGTPARPDPNPRSFADHVMTQAIWQHGEASARQQAFWTTRLQQVPRLAVPSDRRRPAHPSFDSGCLTLKIPDPLWHELASRARELGVRPLVPWLTLWFLLLSRYGGQDDLVLTMPVAGRGPVFQGVCGYFSNLVALRLRRREGDSFDGLMQAVSAVLEAALQHQDLPFSLAVAGAARADEGAAPLTAAGFAWDTYKFLGPDRPALVRSGPQGEETWAVPGLSLTRIPLKTQRDESDLQLRAVRTPTGMHVVFEYSEDLYERSTLERWSRHFLELARACAADGRLAVDRIPLVAAAEREATVDAWNQTARPYAMHATVHGLVSQAAQAHPHATALVCGDQRMSFAELDALSNRLARRLQASGVARGSVVGICIDRSIPMVVAVLATLKAGAAYMPLDPGYPPDRLAYMLADAAPTAVLVQSAHEPLIAQSMSTGAVLPIESTLLDLGGFSPLALDPVARADDALYVIHTSGSTGRPKGARVTHRGFVNLLTWYGSYGFDTSDRFLVVSSFNFDLTQKNLFAPLITGGQLHLPAPGFDAEALARTIDTAGITTINCTPTAFSSLLEFRTAGNFASLRNVFLGGEPIRTGDLRRWLAGLQGRLPAIHNTYGPTECTDVVSAFTWNPALHGDEVPIGQPICNTQLYVLDPHGHIVPPGVPGEVHVAGDGVGLGYLNQPALTAEKFVPNTLGGTSDRLYRTGDVGCYRADGNILYLGRADRQVKLRGFRIELGEIEETALRHPEVRQVVVDAIPSRTGELQLACWVVWKQAPCVDDLRALLAAALPAYMLPAVVMGIADVPLTPSGKIDRKALPAPQDTPTPTASEAATNPREQFVIDIWAQVLGTTAIGRRDNFFEIGGNSLSALRVLALIRKSIVRGECSLRTLFECPTVDALAGALQGGVELDIA